MKICILASGSKCNASYLETNNKKILIDFGTSLKYTKEKLYELGVDIKDIDYVFITHSHGDHTYGLETFVKKYNAKIFLTEKIYSELSIDIPNPEFIEDKIVIDSLTIDFVKLSHDVKEILGYIFMEDEKKLVYITDTGYINRKYFDKLSNADCYVIESNHDVEMLMNGRYQYYTKIRIVGDKGHLSNEKSSEFISEVIGKHTKNVILIHLSEENNTKELARNSLESRIHGASNIYISTQKERTDLITV